MGGVPCGSVGCMRVKSTRMYQSCPLQDFDNSDRPGTRVEGVKTVVVPSKQRASPRVSCCASHICELSVCGDVS